MIDLKDYVPEEIKFKLPVTVKFPEVIFSDCVCMDDVKKKLSLHFVTIQEKDVIANRVMDEYEISTIRANYGEIAEEQMPELESQFAEHDLTWYYVVERKKLQDSGVSEEDAKAYLRQELEKAAVLCMYAEEHG